MGNACGCDASDEKNEVSVKKSAPKKQHNDYMSNFDSKAYDKSNKFSKEEKGKIVKIQAAIRSKSTRKGMQDGTYFQDKLVDDPALEFMDNVDFEDGTVYNG